jgi:hypothetical protein
MRLYIREYAYVTYVLIHRTLAYFILVEELYIQYP